MNARNLPYRYLSASPGITHLARSRLIADWLILKPWPLATVHFTVPVAMVQVKGPERTRVPGEKSGVPSPGFEPHWGPTQVTTFPEALRRTLWTTFLV